VIGGGIKGVGGIGSVVTVEVVGTPALGLGVLVTVVSFGANGGSGCWVGSLLRP